MKEGEDYYLNDDGLIVFTKYYLLRRGYCCGNGCINCPYNYSGVSEPQRSLLIDKRRHNEKKDS